MDGRNSDADSITLRIKRGITPASLAALLLRSILLLLSLRNSRHRGGGGVVRVFNAKIVKARITVLHRCFNVHDAVRLPNRDDDAIIRQWW